MEPTLTPELIGILAVGATVIGLLLTFRRDARADSRRLRADMDSLRSEVRADLAQMRAENQSLREEMRADLQVFRQEVRADFAQVRAELADVRTDVSNLRTDVQALTERTSRLEGVIEGLFAGRDRRNDAA
ncbi:MAG: DUF2746 domain-containing protein [Chloroflexi bacterium]|nr:DUF2746 domain-containing protein [Chloroflexota bacterium]